MSSFCGELKLLRFWRSVVAELLATMFYIFCSCGATLKRGPSQEAPSEEHISLAFGLAFATVIQCVGLISGGHVNPAITTALAVTNKMSILRAIFYIAAQVSGAIAGAGLLYGLTPAGDRGSLGIVKLNDHVTIAQGVGVEAVLSFLLVWTVFSTLDPARHNTGYGVPLAIGLAVTACHLVGIQYTGCGINPARAFGPAVVMNQYKDHWVYWAGPLLGGVLAGLIYEILFASPATTYAINDNGGASLCSMNCCQVNYGDEDATSWYGQGLGSYDDLRHRQPQRSGTNEQFGSDAVQMQDVSTESINNRQI